MSFFVIACEVINVVGISLDIVQFFRRLCFPEDRLNLVQLTLFPRLFPRSHRRRLPEILEILTIDLVRQKVSDITELLIADRPAHVRTLVHPAAESVSIFARWFLSVSEKCGPLHIRRGLQTRKAQDSWREIKECHNAVGG